jgi:integrase
VAIVRLAETGGRTDAAGFSLRWDLIDLKNNVKSFGGDTMTKGSSDPVPLTGIAHDVLVSWQKEQGDKNPFLFPSPVKLDKPISTVRTHWKTTLTNAKVTHFPINHLRHVFCTRLSWAATGAGVQRAMRHSSPETKRHDQLRMVELVRQNLEKANEKCPRRWQTITFL